MIDLLYLAHGRAEFTAASAAALLANTDWSRVARALVYFDGDWYSKPGAKLVLNIPESVETHFHYEKLGGPVAVMNHYLGSAGIPRLTPGARGPGITEGTFAEGTGSEIFAKIDNDTIVPPGWLDACLGVMDTHQELGLLGIEPPASRTPAPWAGGHRAAVPELGIQGAGYAASDSIGGIGVMRRAAFAASDGMVPHAIYGGFTDWQWRHPEVVRGWITPPLKVFLLDRLPVEPWASLSREYIARGEQRVWTNYDPADAGLWEWWTAKNGPQMNGMNVNEGARA